MYNNYMGYGNINLGVDYDKKHSIFSLWSPKAKKVELNLYKDGSIGDPFAIYVMNKNDEDIWKAYIEGDLNGIYYTYSISFDGKKVESHDPYAFACGVNGNRSMVIDLRETNPDGFDMDKGPIYKNKTDISIIEISVADATGDVSSNVVNKGKYIGLAEENTANELGIKTALEYICDLGVTHVQIMPCYDFASIDETKSDSSQYNWGYDPFNYNIPEGSYSTDPFNGAVRINEFKQMVHKFHERGIGVIMDVVYNHVYDIEGSCFQRTNPNYFFRMDGDKYSNASACGNEIASEMPMTRKYIIDSLCYWAKEYHIDGFRFDLMGVLDIETLNLAANELKEINPDIILYGEGWTGGTSTLPDSERALKINVSKLNGIGAFSDDFRDSVKGHVFNSRQPGFVNGGTGYEEQIKAAITCPAWADKADKVINYVSCHDNLTLWDKLFLSSQNASKEQRYNMNKLAAAMTFTAQGIPFFLMGEEIARIKHLKDGEIIENSYNVPLYVNSIKYDEVSKNLQLLNYYKGLIKFRKLHKALRMNDSSEIKSKINFIDTSYNNFIEYIIRDDNEELLVVYNANPTEILFDLPEGGTWNVYINSESAGNTVIDQIKDQTVIKPISCLVAVKSNE